jgi:hypothetical protein
MRPCAIDGNARKRPSPYVHDIFWTETDRCDGAAATRTARGRIKPEARVSAEAARKFLR